MKIKFLNDHVDYKQGEVVHGHPNAEYLVTLGVARKVEDEKKEEKKEVDATKKAEVPKATIKKSADIKIVKGKEVKKTYK